MANGNKLTPKQEAFVSAVIIPPQPVLRLTRKQWALWKELLQGTSVADALVRTRCTDRDASLVYHRVRQHDERVLFRKLAALRLLGTHLAMWGQTRRISESVGTQYPEDHELARCLLFVITDPTLTPVARCAVGMLLDYFDPPWRSRLGPEELGPLLDRDSVEVTAWKKEVKRRDRGCCQGCGVRKGLHVHHVIPWALAPELRVVTSNGVTLCSDCHAGRHPTLANFVRGKDGGEEEGG